MRDKTSLLLLLIGSHALAFAALLYLFLNTSIANQLGCLLAWLAFVSLSQMLASRSSYSDLSSIGNGYLTIFGVLMPAEWFFIALLWGKSHLLGTTVLVIYLGGYFLNPFAFPKFLPKARLLWPTGEKKQKGNTRTSDPES